MLTPRCFCSAAKSKKMEIDEDEVDNKVFGNIFHRAAELFYLGLASSDALTTDGKGGIFLVEEIHTIISWVIFRDIRTMIETC